MDDAQRKQFIEEGLVVLRGVLSPAQVASLNSTFDRHVAALPSTTLQTMLNDEDLPGCYPNGRGRRFWSPDYMRLVAHPLIEPMVGELLSDPVFGFALPETPVAHAPCDGRPGLAREIGRGGRRVTMW